MRQWLVAGCAVWLAACGASKGARELDDFLRQEKIGSVRDLIGTLRFEKQEAVRA